MFTLTFAGDESGDVSFSFDKGASRYFVVAVIATAAPESLRRLLADVRERSGLPAQYEFSFNVLSSAPLRRRTFEALAEADFEGWAVVVDKTTLPDSFRVMRRLDFYLYFVRVGAADSRRQTRRGYAHPGRVWLARASANGTAAIHDDSGHPSTFQAHSGAAFQERAAHPGGRLGGGGYLAARR